jgi:hypothetical protein
MSAAFIFMTMVALAGTTAPGATDTNTFRVEEIRAAERAVVAALESPDPTAWVYMYTEDAVFLESGGPVSGRLGLLDMAKAMKPLSSVTSRPSAQKATATWLLALEVLVPEAESK